MDVTTVTPPVFDVAQKHCRLPLVHRKYLVLPEVWLPEHLDVEGVAEIDVPSFDFLEFPFPVPDVQAVEVAEEAVRVFFECPAVGLDLALDGFPVTGDLGFFVPGVESGFRLVREGEGDVGTHGDVVVIPAEIDAHVVVPAVDVHHEGVPPASGHL